MLTPDYLFWFGAGLLATEPLSCRGGWLYAPPADVFTAVDGNRSHGSSDPERHRRMDGSPGIAAAAHDDPRLPQRSL
jgi:hypothetical protein